MKLFHLRFTVVIALVIYETSQVFSQGHLQYYCINCQNNTLCNQTTGLCDGGCMPGWKGDRCDTQCDPGFYGDCTGRCGNCLNNDTCERDTGECPSGCADGWTGHTCDLTACNGTTWGQNCEKTCSPNCSDPGTCEKLTGRCTYGCDKSYRLPLCVNKCEDYRYGASCAFSCGHCADGMCEKIDGNCPDGNCTAGWYELTCDRECEDGYYGENCLYECGHCKESCNKSTGICNSGCQPGWKGDYCLTSCPSGSYGDKCSEQCGNCVNGTDCQTTDGVCGNCEAGWQGTTCKQVCVSGYYGPDCNTKCGKCANGTPCDRITGLCPGECAPGWLGQLCSEACAAGKYGEDCTLDCGNCQNVSLCSNEDGRCASCQPGYKPPYCTSECTAGTYGANCYGTCGNCRGGSVCDRSDGTCTSGCQDTWSGGLCLTKVVEPPSKAGAIAGGIIAAILIIAIIVAIVIIVIRKRNHDKSDRGRTNYATLKPVNSKGYAVPFSKQFDNLKSRFGHRSYKQQRSSPNATITVSDYSNGGSNGHAKSIEDEAGFDCIELQTPSTSVRRERFNQLYRKLTTTSHTGETEMLLSFKNVQYKAQGDDNWKRRSMAFYNFAFEGNEDQSLEIIEREASKAGFLEERKHQKAPIFLPLGSSPDGLLIVNASPRNCISFIKENRIQSIVLVDQVSDLPQFRGEYYECSFWHPSEEVPSDICAMLTVLCQVMDKYLLQRDRTVLVCYSQRQGHALLLAVLLNILANLNLKNMVDIPGDITAARKISPDAANTYAQFKYCHDIVYHYINTK